MPNPSPFSWNQFFTNFKTAPLGLRAFFLFIIIAFITSLLYIAIPGFRDLLYNTIGEPTSHIYFAAFVVFWVIYLDGRTPLWFYWATIFIILIHLGTKGWIEYGYYIDREIFFWKYDTRFWRYAWNFAIPVFWLGILSTKSVREYFTRISIK